MHRITITLPDKIYKQLATRAKNNLRSLSNQVLYELTNSQSQPINIPDFPLKPEPGIPMEPYKITCQSEQTSTSSASASESAPGIVTFPPEPKYEPVEAPREHITTPGGVAVPPVVEPDNEYYKKIRKGYATLYGPDSPEWQELQHLASRHDIKAFMKTQHRSDVEQIITNSYEHTLSIYEFEELLDYITGDPDARNI